MLSLDNEDILFPKIDAITLRYPKPDPELISPKLVLVTNSIELM